MANINHLVEDLIGDIVYHVEQEIIGRVANKVGSRRTGSIETLLRFVAKSGQGNHLEIGTLFGGSAIPVAILKKKLLLPGMVICIDPLDGYYNQEKDIQSGHRVNPYNLFKNINHFGLGNRILVMKSKSVPCPKFVDIGFSTAYIDGDHENGVPLHDWKCVRDKVSKFVIFDNCDKNHPEVREACMKARLDPEWKEVYNKDITYVVERII